MKLLAFFALCLHWFNPFVWFAFILAGRDMEMSCDEVVLKQMKEDIRAEYSASLLHLATGKKVFLATTLCFGEESPKQRIQNIMNYRKPSFWIVSVAMVGCVAATIAFASNPKKEQENMGQTGATEESFFINEHVNTPELEEIDGFFKALGSDVKLESFDQGHTDAVVWFALQKMLLEYNLDIQQDEEKYFAKQEIVEDYIRLYFDVPHGFLGRLPKELPTDADEKAVVLDHQNICFFDLLPRENYRYEITYADKIMGKYVVGGQTWNASDEQSEKSMFYAILTKDADSGNLLMNQYSIEGENAPFQNQNMGFAEDTFLGKYAIDLSQKREKEGESFSGKMDVDSVSYDRINQFLASFFTCPVLANFDQDNMYAAVVFAVQKVLRTDLSTLTFHQSADYYTMDDKSFEEYMKSYFCIPENLFSQMNEEANGFCVWRAGNQIVFEYRSMTWADGMEIDQIEEREGEYIVFGHNRLQSIENSPFYEFAAVLVPQPDGEYRVKEFQIH